MHCLISIWWITSSLTFHWTRRKCISSCQKKKKKKKDNPEYYWSLLVKHHHTQSVTTQVPRIIPDRLWHLKCVELRWLVTFICQQEPESLFCMCFYCPRQEQTPATRKEPHTQKKQILHWPMAQGTKGAALHAYRRGSNRVYDCIIPSLSLITSPPIGGQWKPLHWSRRTRHHSFTCLLGAFVRWLLAEKGKQINTSPMGLTGNLYLGWNMSGTSLPDSFNCNGAIDWLQGSHSSTSWPLENHFGAHGLTEATLWWLLITKEAGKVFLPLPLMELYLTLRVISSSQWRHQNLHSQILQQLFSNHNL